MRMPTAISVTQNSTAMLPSVFEIPAVSSLRRSRAYARVTS
ncbi:MULTISPECIES: hypothetical protein [unclassified Amycolatopsis]|nr:MULTISPECIES: hypothetical protein [unclassified Amycolatopsis]